MNFNKLLKKISIVSLSACLLFNMAESTYADSQTYSFSDLDIKVEVPTDLLVFTRNVSSANTNLELIKATADQLRVTFQQHGIYLEAIPNDVSYELLISGKSVSKNEKDFNTLTDAQLNEGLQNYKKQCEAVQTDQIENVSIYKNDKATFYQSDVISVSNDKTVYIKKYYTVMQGKEVNFTLQSKDTPITEQQNQQLKSVVDSAVFQPVSSSIFDSPIFTELSSYFIGFLITLVVLGGIAYFLSKSTKKKKI